jgi:hypothetical protein
MCPPAWECVWIQSGLGPGWVEDWRHTPQVQPIRCSPFPMGVPHEPNRKLVSSPRHFQTHRADFPH